MVMTEHILCFSYHDVPYFYFLTQYYIGRNQLQNYNLLIMTNSQTMNSLLGLNNTILKITNSYN